VNTSTQTSPGVRLRPGNGVLARHEDIVLLCEMLPGTEDCVRHIINEVKAAADADQPGRQMVRRLVKALAASGDRFPSLCAFGVVGDGVAVAVHGNARLRVTMTDGELLLDGQDAVTLVDRVVVGPVLSITGEIGAEMPGFCPWSELTSGVVRADALQYGTFGEPVPATAAEPAMMAEPAMAAEPAMMAEPAMETEEQMEPPAPQEEAMMDGDPAPQPENESHIIGVSCAKGHFNDPADQYCGVCGIGLTQAGRRSAQQERPSLGVLMLDDGTSLPMTKDYVIGRAPESAEEVSAGEVMLLRLMDPLVSGVHARVRMEGWDVALIDAGSANGTFMREPGSNWCVRLPSGGRVVLRTGAIVTVGHRQFRYDSYRRP
jgi:hypothetical protein